MSSIQQRNANKLMSYMYNQIPSDPSKVGSDLNNEEMNRCFQMRYYMASTLRGRICALFLVAGVVIFLVVTYSLNGTLKTRVHPGRIQWTSSKVELPTEVDQYAIVFDAGSTGSRVHVYRFTVPLTKEGRLTLKDEVFEQVKPGLSAYADNPGKAAQSLIPMLKRCLEVMPPSMYNSTPIILKATAGLRQLAGGVADNILNEVTMLLKSYPFQLGPDGVDIMDGVDEGIFSWVTLNSLLNLQDEKSGMAVALDLGGGSTQITFDPWDKETLIEAPSHYLQNFTVFQKTYQLYTHSYLGLGLMSTRFSLLGGKKAMNGLKLSSSCLLVGQSTTWKYDNDEYNISGPASQDIDTCKRDIMSLVQSQVKNIVELNRRTLYIFSYFFEKAVDAEILDPEKGGKLTVEDYLKAGTHVLQEETKKDIFLGMDLLYMYFLLHDGYGLGDAVQLNLVKQINHVEMSWSLGAAYRLLSSIGMAR